MDLKKAIGILPKNFLSEGGRVFNYTESPFLEGSVPFRCAAFNNDNQLALGDSHGRILLLTFKASVSYQRINASNDLNRLLKLKQRIPINHIVFNCSYLFCSLNNNILVYCESILSRSLTSFILGSHQLPLHSLFSINSLKKTSLVLSSSKDRVTLWEREDRNKGKIVFQLKSRKDFYPIQSSLLYPCSNDDLRPLPYIITLDNNSDIIIWDISIQHCNIASKFQKSQWQRQEEEDISLSLLASHSSKPQRCFIAASGTSRNKNILLTWGGESGECILTTKEYSIKYLNSEPLQLQIGSSNLLVLLSSGILQIYEPSPSWETIIQLGVQGCTFFHLSEDQQLVFGLSDGSVKLSSLASCISASKRHDRKFSSLSETEQRQEVYSKPKLRMKSRGLRVVNKNGRDQLIRRPRQVVPLREALQRIVNRPDRDSFEDMSTEPEPRESISSEPPKQREPRSQGPLEDLPWFLKTLSPPKLRPPLALLFLHVAKASDDGWSNPHSSMPSANKRRRLREAAALSELRNRCLLRPPHHFPDTFRQELWELILELPKKQLAFDAYGNNGIDPMYKNLEERLPLYDKQMLRKMQKFLSVVGAWCPELKQVDWIPQLAFGVLTLYGNKPLFAFEVFLSILLWWGGLGCRSFRVPAAFRSAKKEDTLSKEGSSEVMLSSSRETWSWSSLLLIGNSAPFGQLTFGSFVLSKEAPHLWSHIVMSWDILSPPELEDLTRGRCSDSQLLHGRLGTRVLWPLLRSWLSEVLSMRDLPTLWDHFFCSPMRVLLPLAAVISFLKLYSVTLLTIPTYESYFSWMVTPRFIPLLPLVQEMYRIDSAFSLDYFPSLLKSSDPSFLRKAQRATITLRDLGWPIWRPPGSTMTCAYPEMTIGLNFESEETFKALKISLEKTLKNLSDKEPESYEEQKELEETLNLMSNQLKEIEENEQITKLIQSEQQFNTIMTTPDILKQKMLNLYKEFAEKLKPFTNLWEDQPEEQVMQDPSDSNRHARIENDLSPDKVDVREAVHKIAMKIGSRGLRSHIDSSVKRIMLRKRILEEEQQQEVRIRECIPSFQTVSSSSYSSQMIRKLLFNLRKGRHRFMRLKNY